MRIATVLAVVLLGSFTAAERASAAPVEAVEAAVTERPAPRGYVQLGIGFYEMLHAELGLFATPRLTLDVQWSLIPLMGNKLGLGASYAFGSAAAGRPPRHAFLLGARAMVDTDLRWDSTTEGLGAFLVPSVGYRFLTDGGFTARVQAGPGLGWRMKGRDESGVQVPPGPGLNRPHQGLVVASYMVVASIGRASRDMSTCARERDRWHSRPLIAPSSPS